MQYTEICKYPPPPLTINHPNYHGIHVHEQALTASNLSLTNFFCSVRLVSMKDQKNLSTVLPPPSVSPLTQVLSVAYNREYSLVYLLVNPTEIWVYTMK